MSDLNPKQPGGSDGAGGSGSGKRSGAELYGRPEPVNLAQYLKFGLWLVVGLIAGIFIFGNSEVVEVNFVFATADVPLFVALLVAFGFGLLLGAFGVWMSSRRRAKRERAKRASDGQKKSG